MHHVEFAKESEFKYFIPSNTQTTSLTKWMSIIYTWGMKLSWKKRTRQKKYPDEQGWKMNTRQFHDLPCLDIRDDSDCNYLSDDC